MIKEQPQSDQERNIKIQQMQQAETAGRAMVSGFPEHAKLITQLTSYQLLLRSNRRNN